MILFEPTISYTTTQSAVLEDSMNVSEQSQEINDYNVMMMGSKEYS